MQCVPQGQVVIMVQPKTSDSGCEFNTPFSFMIWVLGMKLNKTFYMWQGYHISVSKENYCAFESICTLMHPRLPLIWCLLDIPLDLQ